MIISLIRIPLYGIWLDAMDNHNYFKALLLIFLVAKNNPIFPFFSFALFGGWLATLFESYDFKTICKKVIPLCLFLLILGVGLYINLEDTMLEREIDLKWYSIMVAQLGLFILLLLLFIKYNDYKSNSRNRCLSTFLARFSKGGLTAFFLESVVSAIIFRILFFFNKNITFNINLSLLYGFILAIIWGVILMFWERKNYKYGLEYYMTNFLNKYGESSKKKKLNGELKY